MEFVKRNWKRTPHNVRKPLVFIIGWLLVLLGVLLLPLPGPGWGIIFVGFAVLATEFASAKKVRDKLVGLFKIAIARWRMFWHGLKRKK